MTVRLGSLTKKPAGVPHRARFVLSAVVLILAGVIPNFTITQPAHADTQTIPVYRLANWITHERLFTTSTVEVSTAIASYPGWVSEGTAFDSVPSNYPGAIPVYRLANWITHERLFTTSTVEVSTAIASYPGWVSEGIGFYSVPSTDPGAVPVYRLANWMTHERLFTVSTVERDNAVANLPGWVDEGIGFYAATATVGSDPDLANGTPICGQPILNSPYSYDGAAGSYTSGTAGLPTFGTAGSDFPQDTAGMVLPPETHDYPNYDLTANTVYYLEPGVHIGSFLGRSNDTFVGGLNNGSPTILSGDNAGRQWGIDSYDPNGALTVEYLTYEQYNPPVDQGAMDQGESSGWTIKYNTITLNAPGAGVFTATNSTLADNCMTLNGQYGFQASGASDKSDSVTTGPYNINVENNEISYNDTCDLEGAINNAAAGLTNYNPVPAQDQNPTECAGTVGDGNQGGFKLWQTDGATIENNYIHNNWGPGGWADTNNANTTWTGNTITDNDGPAIDEEVSYNFSITNNYMAGNDIIDGLGNAGFPAPAIYISESGSDTTFGGVPACPEASCSDQGAYTSQSPIQNNTFVDNGGSVFLWQNSNRYCSSGIDGVCTLVDGGQSSPFTLSSCATNIPTATLNTTTYVGDTTGSPAENWYDGCQWRTENVSISQNEIDFNPANVMDCNNTDWPDCGAGGVFSEYGGTPDTPGGWATPTDITFYQNNNWSDNLYNGPSTFVLWNQGSGDNPISWSDWTGPVGNGDKCSSAGEKQSGFCTGPFGQDGGSTYNP